MVLRRLLNAIPRAGVSLSEALSAFAHASLDGVGGAQGRRKSYFALDISGISCEQNFFLLLD